MDSTEKYKERMSNQSQSKIDKETVRSEWYAYKRGARASALQLAISMRTATEDADGIVSNATKYYDFLVTDGEYKVNQLEVI